MPTTRFATLVRQARERRGLTQSQLGARVGLTQSSVSLWERGEVVPTSVELLRKLERVLTMTPGTLLAAAGYPVKLTAMTPEDAIGADPSLKEDEKAAALTMLRAFRSRRGKAS